jgi:hypothetical protein
LKRLRVEARRRGVSVKELLATLVRRGLDEKGAAPKRYRCPTFHLGVPRVSLDKALSLATTLEDEETLRKLRGIRRRKP